MAAPVVIIGNGASTCTRRVAAVCKFVGVEYKLNVVEFADWASLKSPEHIALQPFGQVPVLTEEDGFILTESRAISRYIVMKHGKGSTLLPPADDIKAIALFEAACSIEVANFDQIVSDIVKEKVFKLWFGQKTDEARVAELFKALGPKLDGYERILSKNKYLAGDTFTLADVFHLPYGYHFEKHAGGAEELQKRPNVARWWNDISNRPEWLAIQDSA
ncbi:glutathione S-transferase [Auriculariales sp. MPI-PUGE-AT-0066]|nr:glutathione S-transferase [Auriculariales sp. MPI-PUGE-AT-0066]